MPSRNNALKDRLSRYRKIQIRVTGRNSGRTISIPVWFALEDEKVYLLPVQGSDTQWYKNVIDARGAVAKLQAVPITDATGVSSAIEKSRDNLTRPHVALWSSLEEKIIASPPQSDSGGCPSRWCRSLDRRGPGCTGIL